MLPVEMDLDFDQGLCVVGIEVVDTKAVSGEHRPAPGGGPGSLTVIDNRTGKKYEIKVQQIA